MLLTLRRNMREREKSISALESMYDFRLLAFLFVFSFLSQPVDTMPLLSAPAFSPSINSARLGEQQPLPHSRGGDDGCGHLTYSMRTYSNPYSPVLFPDPTHDYTHKRITALESIHTHPLPSITSLIEFN